jgi:protein-S-isoprenylcysteine O-methyltransferase Ste14
MPAANKLRVPTWANLFWFAFVLFVSAGRLDILVFWLYLVILAGSCVGGALFPANPDIAQERGLRTDGQFVPVVALAIAGLDRGRFHWSDSVPVSLQLVALILTAASMGFETWADHENPFASSVIGIQNDRGDHVITSGPHALVRHPAFLTGLVIAPAMGVGLGSWLAAAWGALWVPYVVRATAKVDRFLITELPSYDAYARHVRYRLFPGVW